ncbi:MAG TPA: glycosyltransferase family 4 protein [Solirubrobacteraceae bacterium]|jgi:glycosyltransferase involved in cell wall biosynthesis|nr:glycosyltransferase family 4 protein [Solirubrobacteraceae bacterium]
MRVEIVDPSAYTPPYDHALCSALAAAGAQVELLTSRFPYGPLAPPDGYARREIFYRHSHAGAAAGARSRGGLTLKLAEHVPGMLRCRRIAQGADIAHFQWLPVQQLDAHLLPMRRRGGGPRLVITAHDVMPREPRRGQLRGQRLLYERFDAIVVHSQHGARRLTTELGVDPQKVHVIPHGAFAHLAAAPAGPPPFGQEPPGPVVLFFGLIRPYKGLDVLLQAWRSLSAGQRGQAQLWVAGMPRMDLGQYGLAGVETPAGRSAAAQEGIHVAPAFIADADLPAYFARADLVVLPYREIDQSGVLFTALAFGKPLLLSDIGGFPEIAATGAATTVPAGDPEVLAGALTQLLGDPAALTRMAAAAQAAADGPYSWVEVAHAHMRLYERLLDAPLGENGAATWTSP